MGDSRILSWLDSIVTLPPQEQDLSSSDRPRKRPRLDHDHLSLSNSKPTYTKKRESRSRLPTPSTSGSPPSRPSTWSNRDRSSMASKRPRSPDNDQNEEARDPDQFHNDLTPRPPRSFIIPEALDADTPSQAPSITSSSRFSSSRASSKASRISRNSSPTKQLRNAELQQTGFARASFEDDDQPASLKLLTQRLRDIEEGYAILPRDLQNDLAGERVRPWMFGDKPQFGALDLPGVRTVRKIHRLARRCFKENLAESSWNNDVHSQVLEWVMRDSPSSDDELLDYRCCLTAQIIKAYRPEHAPSKMVDFCICVQPGTNSPYHEAIQTLCLNRPGLSINHTDWGDLTKYPISISIETKGPEQSYDTALLQVATWHSSQWRSLCWGRHDPIHAIEFLPGIIIIKHDWYFVATDLDRFGKARTFERIPLGSTESILGIYKLSMALLTLCQWVRDQYWPAFQADILGLKVEVDAGETGAE
ncbi:hypothetical protein CEP52_005549 [Fusarium oligoseptatum]|uniref:PD-(D/E)XK nuclease-like domain-containing protein n=1 Tax=Fusarium oligoseptatum TaxID=2604345 RepID=A0A428TXE3_9HYPO|nr:hypothetical protein CEP52_005549 [Fusarium oligoseptatum]